VLGVGAAGEHQGVLSLTPELRRRSPVIEVSIHAGCRRDFSASLRRLVRCPGNDIMGLGAGESELAVPKFAAIICIALALPQNGPAQHCAAMPQPRCAPVAVPAATRAQVATAELVGLYPTATVVYQPILVPSFVFQWVGSSGYSGDVLSPSVAAPVVPTPAPAPSSADAWPVALPVATIRGPDPVVALLRDRCARCHTAPTGRAGVQLLDTSGRLWTNIDRARVSLAVSQARMPPDSRLSENEINIILNWAK
jgi:hypothetical protein